jgi:hypothetical protein
VQRRAGFREYDRAIPVPEIFQVRCLETDELFDVGACNKHTATERQSTDPGRAVAMLARGAGEGRASSLSDWGFDLREAPSVLSQIVG